MQPTGETRSVIIDTRRAFQDLYPALQTPCPPYACRVMESLPDIPATISMPMLCLTSFVCIETIDPIEVANSWSFVVVIQLHSIVLAKISFVFKICFVFNAFLYGL